MRISVFVLSAVLLSAAICFPQAPPQAQAEIGFSIDNIDKTADPCVDFYQYACGNWLKRTEIPADQPEWVSFTELYERNLVTERNILEKAAAGGPNRGAIDQKVGDYYGACIDEKAADAKGLDPLKPELERIAAMKDKGALIDAIAHAHLVGPNPLFNFYSAPDLHNADMVIGYIDQGGLTLPDRNYYIKEDDPKMVEMRKRLVDYATQMFTMAGQPAQQAADSAQTILRIETALAKASMDRTLRRDPKNRDHKMTREAAITLAPNFYLARYFTAMATPSFSELNVSNPEFFKQVNGVIESEPLDALKTYVQWHMLNSAAPWLSKPFVDTNFKFQQALTGQAEIQARWKRCVDAADGALGEALGQKYVEETFGAEGKQRMLKMVDALEKALEVKSVLVGVMVHELKTPIQVIMGNAELLAESICGELKPDQKERVRTIENGADELLRLIDSTLNMVRLERGKMALVATEVCVSDLLAELKAEFQSAFQRKGIELEVQLPPPESIMKTDRVKLKEIFRNLLENARKFTHSGKVTVEFASRDNDRVEFVVRDTGVGIKDDLLPKVFELFYQVDASPEEPAGAGLGLNIVKRLVDALSGEINVNSQLGKGTTFRVTLAREITSSSSD